MANPSISSLHVDRPLTNVSIAFSQRKNFAARQIFPAIPVTNQSNKYFVYDKTDWLRPQAEKRAPGAEAPVGGWRVSTDNYLCERFSLAHDIADPERANSDPAINLDVDATEYVTENVELTLENQWASEFFTTAVWSGASNSSDMVGQANPASTASNFQQWNNVTSTPIEDVRGEARAIHSVTGYYPNTFVLGPQVFDKLIDHPDVVERIKYTTQNQPDEATLAMLLKVDRVIVLNAIKNAGAEGAAGSFSFIGGKNALLCYSEPQPGLKKPSAGYSFVWTSAGAPMQGVQISRIRLDRNESDRITGETWLDYKVVSATLGAFFSAATA